MHTNRFAPALIAIAAVTGCATIHPATSVTTFGQVDLARDGQLSQTANDMPDTTDVSAITVVQGKLPQGLALAEDGSKIVVGEGYESTYEVIGSIKADYTPVFNSALWKNMFWTWSYDETWRKALCYPQVPLKLATIGIWSYMVPLNYPCWATAPGDENDRQSAMVERLKRGALAMGGNLVVLSAMGGLQVIQGNGYGAVSTSTYNATSLEGFVIRAKGKAPGGPAISMARAR